MQQQQLSFSPVYLPNNS